MYAYFLLDESLKYVQLCCKFPRDVLQRSHSETYSFAAHFPEMYSFAASFQRCTIDESVRDVQLCCKFPKDVLQMSRSETYSFAAKFPRDVLQRSRSEMYRVAASFPEMYDREENCRAVLRASQSGADGGSH